MSDLWIARKYSFRIHGRRVPLRKQPNERQRHVLLKACVYSLYLPEYPDLQIERKIGAKYKPDLVQLDADGRPRFWAECAKVSPRKAVHIGKRYRTTRIVYAHLESQLESLKKHLRTQLAGVSRSAPIEFLEFPEPLSRFIAEDGTVTVTFGDCRRSELQ
ncbi:MAG: hypothetical protein GF333_02440 [Candidatus Omnitrophica bacterium]|nr:hypothetical protein [Candidatus Omnitrophota bacterium]